MVLASVSVGASPKGNELLKQEVLLPGTFHPTFLLPVKISDLGYLRVLSGSRFIWRKDTGTVTCGEKSLTLTRGPTLMMSLNRGKTEPPTQSGTFPLGNSLP